jgi:hypothetical protein
MPHAVRPPARSHRLLAVVAAALAAAALTAVPAAAAPYVVDGRSIAPVVESAPLAGVSWARPRALAPTRTVAGPVSAALTATGPATTTVGGYAFMAEPTPGDPIRWAACVPVHWVFNPNHAPTGGFRAVQSAVARVAAATGLTFVYDGTASATPTSSYLATPGRPLLIGWSSSTESSLLANQPLNLVGMTQSTWSRDAANGFHITSGVIAFSDRVVAPATGPSSWFTFALHELGHAVGLAHTADATQIMHASIPPTRSDYGSGDLAGLRRVGASGC